MNLRFLSSAIVLAGLSAPLFAADASKNKILEKFEHMDEKTIKIGDAKAKIVNTQDKEHSKALELKMDYAKPNSYPGFSKSFPEATLNPTRYSGFSIWVRSDVETSFNVSISGSYKRKDGKIPAFGGGGFKATSEWKQIIIPFEKFSRNGAKFWKEGKQVIIPGGGPMDEDDYGGITRFGIGTSIESRGTSTVGHLMFDSLELIEKSK